MTRASTLLAPASILRILLCLTMIVAAGSVWAAAPTISSFSPLSGPIGTTVTIIGTNFSSTIASDTVKFHGTTGSITSATTTQIVAVVLAGTTTGTITVTVGSAGTATSGSSFTVTAPTITSFTPGSAGVGAMVTITGTNFSTTPANNIVKFNGTQAVVTSATATQLVTTVPTGATTGKITVAVLNSPTATSSATFTLLLNPTITSFTPPSGGVGTSVTITGTNFSTTTTNDTVKFNGTTATVSTASATQLVVTVPTGATTGTISVAVLNVPTSATSSSMFTVVPPPTISGFSPGSGAVGSSVTITGTNFSSTIANDTVKFHGTTATVTSATTTQLIASVPSGATTGTISVTVGGSTATSSSSFTVTIPPTITSFSPPSGAAGTSVTIVGTNFSTTVANDGVKFNGTTATVTSATATQLVATVPSAATTGPITVTVSGSTATSGTAFTVTVPPTISGFSPGSGIVGSSVTITGTNFSSTVANNTVKFHGTVAAVTSASTTQLIATVPTGATTGTLTVTVGVATATSSGTFTVTLAPTISGFSPPTGGMGTSVTITGTNFSTTKTNDIVSFNGIAATVTSATATQIIATVPATATTGLITVAVSGASTATSGSSFTVVPAPTITGFDPGSGQIGDVITISGTNFSATPSSNTVKFNGKAATLSAATTTQLTCAVPTGATSGMIAVTVNSMTVTSTTAFTVILPPTISSFSPTSAQVGAPVTIHGTNFSTTPANNAVYFGFPQATVTAATATQLTVIVPDGATTNSPISVIVNGLVGFSSGNFSLPIATISSFSPTAGNFGTSVTISGQNFSTIAAANKIYFNGTLASVTAATSTQLTTSVPNLAHSGPISITIDQQGSASSSSFQVNWAQPSTTQITPTSGVVGTWVTVTGQNFDPTPNDTTVTFTSDSDPTDGARQILPIGSASELTLAVPAGADTGPFTVSTIDGGVSAPSSTPFTVLPSINNVVPPYGEEGQTVSIQGSAFDVNGNDQVFFNGVAATINAGSEGIINVTVPTGGTDGIIQITAAGHTVSSRGNFLDDETAFPPTIASFSPSSGSPGTIVTITGNFNPTPASSVVFMNGTDIPATLLQANATTLVAAVPAGAVTSRIVVVTPKGMAFSSSAFAVNPPAPTITTFSPATGPAGAQVTITGSNFGLDGDGARVYFSGSSTAVTATLLTSKQLLAIVPADAKTGAISVQSNGSTVHTSDVFQMTSPYITSLTPAYGSPGDTVTIRGANFDPSPQNDLLYGSIAATTASPTQLTFVIPAVTSGPVSVTSDGQVAQSPQDLIIRTLPALPVAATYPFTGQLGAEIFFAIGSNQNGAGDDYYALNGFVNSFLNSGRHWQTAYSTGFPVENTDGYLIYIPVQSNMTDGPLMAWHSDGSSSWISSDVIHIDVLGFSPVQGPVGTMVYLTSDGAFDSAPSNNVVTFSGVSATVVSANADTLVVTVPSGATSGAIKVTTPEAILTSDHNYTVGPSFSFTFTPEQAYPGGTITITCQNYDASTQVNGHEMVGFAEYLYGPGSTTRTTGLPATGTCPQFTATVPISNAATGPLVVYAGDEIPTTATDQLVIIGPPSIATITPDQGIIGTTVTIAGFNFDPTAANNIVSFNGTIATNVIVDSNHPTNTLYAVVPPGTTNGPLTVTVGGQLGTYLDGFLVTTATPQITSMSPTTGYVGTLVTIDGSDLNQWPPIVEIAGQKALGVSATDSQVVVRVVEGGAAGTGPLQFYAEQGAPVIVPGTFTLKVPTITSISPASGTTGTTVTITGNGFDPTDLVLFNQAVDAAPVSPESTSTALTVTVPALALDGPIQVHTSEGIAVSSQSFDTGWPVPSISGFTPASGPVGTSVTITGTNFLNSTPANTFVYFGLKGAQLTSVSNTQIVAVVPDGATTSLIHVVVSEVQNASAYSSSDFTVVPPSPPNITSLSPSSGRVGALVTINGTNFDTLTLTGNTITFNGVAANVGAVNATQLFTTVPTGATTGPIQVSTSGGSATSNTFTVLPPVTITGFSPMSGPVGTTVTITGTQFDSNVANDSVIIGNAYANIVSVSATQLLVTVGSAAVVGSTHFVQVTSDGSAATSAATFNVTAPPPLSITGFSPSGGVVGSVVTIAGTGFETVVANDVLGFNGTRAHILSANATQVVAQVPAGATTGTLQLYLSDSQQTASSSASFSVLPLGVGTSTVTIASITPEPSLVGQTYTVQVSVTPIAPSTTPTGSVLVEDTNTSCVIQLPSTSCSMTDLIIGQAEVSAVYSGDSVFASNTATAGHIVNPTSPTEVCGLDPWTTTDNGSAFVPLQQLNAVVYTPGLQHDIAGDGTLSVNILSPVNGASISDTSVDVTGTFDGPVNTGISVNGVVASTVNGNFVATIQLSPGSNVITAVATTLSGSSASSAVSITQGGISPSPVTFTIDSSTEVVGFSPRPVTFDISIGALPNGASIQSVALDANGDGVFDYTAATLGQLPTALLYEQPGTYVATLRIIDSNNNTYLATRLVLVKDRAEQRNMLCDIYAYLKDRLANQDATGASLAYQPAVQQSYLSTFISLGTGMTNASTMLGNIASGILAQGSAELIIVRDNSDQTRNGYPLRMTQGTDGVWRISEM